ATAALGLGDNTITIRATDAFGLAASAAVTVHHGDPQQEPLAVLAVDPAPDADAVLPDTIVSVALHKPFAPRSRADHFPVAIGGAPVEGAWSSSPAAQSASFVPRAPLPPGARAEVRVLGVQPQQGPAMAAPFVSAFTVRRAPTLVRGVVV